MIKILTTIKDDSGTQIYNATVDVLTAEDKKILIDILTTMLEAMNALDKKIHILAEAMNTTVTIDQELRARIADILGNKI